MSAVKRPADATISPPAKVAKSTTPAQEINRANHAVALLQVMTKLVNSKPELQVPATKRIIEKKLGGKWSMATIQLLQFFVADSANIFHTTLATQFWSAVKATFDDFHASNTNPSFDKITFDVDTICTTPFATPEATMTLLLKGAPDAKDEALQTALFNSLFKFKTTGDSLSPLLRFAGELFTHIGLFVMNAGGKAKPPSGQAVYAVDSTMRATFQAALPNDDEDFGGRAQYDMDKGCKERDGLYCPLTKVPFADESGYTPYTAHIVPNSIANKDKTESLFCISQYAGVDVLEEIVSCLNTTSNAVNMEANTHNTYDDFLWAIEAIEGKYYFRRFVDHPKLLCIRGTDGVERPGDSEIIFGTVKKTNLPSPALCNLKYHINKIMKLSGAADFVPILIKDDEDDGASAVPVAVEDLFKLTAGIGRPIGTTA